MKVGFEARKGKTGILLLHGLTGTPDEVEPLGRFLAEHDISTLAPWLEGHGTNPQDLARTHWQDWARSAREAFEEMRSRCTKLFVGGLSMGALQALHLASHFPVSGVLSMDAPIRIHDFRFNGIAIFRFLQWRTSNLTGGIRNPQAPPHKTYPYVATRSLYELKKLMDHVREDLPYVTAPALVVQGRKDSMVPPDNGEVVHQSLGSAVKHLLYLEESDHVVTMDFDKEELFQRTLKFIQTDGVKIE